MNGRLFDPFLKAARVRNRAAFMKEARRGGIGVADGWLELTPYRNLGPKEGF